MKKGKGEEEERRRKEGLPLWSLIDEFSAKKRRWLLNESKLSFAAYLTRMGLITLFMLVDLIAFPSVVFLLPMTTLVHVLISGLGLLIMVYYESKLVRSVGRNSGIESTKGQAQSA